MDFRVLGSLEVVVADQPVVLRSRNLRTLLALLVVHARRVVSVDSAVDGLWGDVPPRTALNLVQGMVSELRKLLDPRHSGLIETVPSGYRLNVEAEQIDAARFERMSREASERLESAPDEAARALSDALALWRGRALGELADEPAFQAEAARLEEARLATLETRLEADLALGRHAQVVGELEGLVAEHPLRERVRGQLMVALYRAGRQAEALRVYEGGRRLLAEELGLEPSPELRHLEQAVLAHSPELQWVPRDAGDIRRSGRPVLSDIPFPAPLAAVARGPFVGRGPEREALDEAWRRATEGSRQAVFLRGEPGAGKTRLVAELSLAAHRSGAMVLHGRCDEDAGIAYQPFVDALTGYVRLCPVEDLRSHVERHGGEVGRLVPDLGRRVPGAPDPAPAEPELERWRLFESVCQLLGDISRRGPVVLVIDDVHWAAAPSLFLMKHLLRSAEPIALLILVTYRDTELRIEHPLTTVLADLRGEPGIERVSLSGLTTADVGTYLEAVAGGSLNASGTALAEDLHTATEGNPFFLIELLRHLSDSGVVHQTEGAWDYAIASGVHLPEGVREVVLRRLSRLSHPAMRALVAASVIGLEFEYRLLDRIPDAITAGHDLLDALDEAEAGGLVASMPGAAGCYRFTHTLVRHVLSGSLSATRHARVHARVGEAIEATYAGSLDSYLAQLAFHFAEAAPVGDSSKAVQYGRQAAAQAIEKAAHEDAAAAFERSLKVLESNPDPAVEFELLLALADTRASLLDGPATRDAVLRAAGVARRHGWAEGLARAARPYGLITDALGQSDHELIALCEEALATMSGGDSALRAQVLVNLANKKAVTTDKPAADALTLEAIAVARRVGDVRTLGLALGARQTYLAGTPDLAEKASVAEEYVALARSTDDPLMTVNAMICRAVSRLIGGDLAGFDEDVDECERVATRIRWVLGLAQCIQWRAMRALLDGRFAEAEALACEVLSYSQQANWRLGFSAQLFKIRYDQGRLHEVLPMAKPVAEQNPGVVGFSVFVAMLHAELGEVAEARRLFAELTAGNLERVPHDFALPLNLANLSLVCCRLDDTASAPALYQRLLPFSGQILMVEPAIICTGAIDRFLGLLCTTMAGTGGASMAGAGTGGASRRALDEGERHFQAALALEEHLGSAPLLARSRLGYAELLARRASDGDLRLAATLLAEVHATAERLGMALVADQAKEQLVAIQPRARAARQSGP